MAHNNLNSQAETVKGHSRKKVDLTGQRYGNLTVRSEERRVGKECRL